MRLELLPPSIAGAQGSFLPLLFHFFILLFLLCRYGCQPPFLVGSAKSRSFLKALYGSSSSGRFPNVKQTSFRGFPGLRKKAKDVVDGEAEVCVEGKKRRLSDDQVRFLEMNFGMERKLESCRKIYLASEIGLDPKQVAVWFQNRRARWKSKQLEEEYIHLKSSHDAVLIEKCRLENEILNLKDKLVQSEEEIRRLSFPSAASELTGVGSPISPLTMTTCFGEFGMEEENGIMHMSPYSDNYSYRMEMIDEPSLWDGMTIQ